MSSPFLPYAGVLERTTHLVHLYLPNDPQVVGVQFWGAVTINDAYGNPAASGVGGAGPSAWATVARGDFFRSPTLRRKGLAAIPENRKGTTQVAFDPDDFTVAGMGATLPLEQQWLHMRVQENRNGVGLLNLAGNPADPVLGAIYPVPPAAVYGLMAPTFTTQATAPSATGCTAGLPPFFDEDLASAAPRPLYLVFSTPLVELCLENLDGVKDLLLSFGPGQPMMTVPAGKKTELFSGQTKAMVIACPAAGGCPFSLHGVLARS